MNLELIDGDIRMVGRQMGRVNGTIYTAQTVKTNLLLQEGEWIVDRTEGLPWLTGALEKGVPIPLIVQLIQVTIEDTVGVLSVDDINYKFDSSTRTLQVNFKGTTIYGKTFTGVI